MADFYQSGVVTTLHRLHGGGLERIEKQLEEFSRIYPIGLVLPALYCEFEAPAMRQMVAGLAHARYLKEVVVTLGRASYAEYQRARSFFEKFPLPVIFVWMDGERMQQLLALLEENGLSAGPDGKGRSCWMAYGYLLDRGECEVIALHDCDILNYSRELLARLCYPVANPTLGFEFCKGYYARVTDRMHGRAMRVNLARVNRIPGDGGLEVGVLAEVQRNCAGSGVCQVDLADNYEHKHQSLSAEDPSKGLRKMARDIAKSLFHTLAGEGVVFSQDHFRSLQVRYVRMAEDTINCYYADAKLNGLEFDRHAEELEVAASAKSLGLAASEFIEDPLGAPLIPNWNRVLAALPDFFERLRQAVSEDMALAQ